MRCDNRRMPAGDDSRETPPHGSAITDVLEAFRRRDPRAAARCARAALVETGVAPVVRTALLHLSGVACHAAGAGNDGARFLAEAARLEREELGCGVGSQHTVHQLALLNQKEVRLADVKRYYLETLKTLRSNRNDVGTGLCLRSLGEIALVAGAESEARVCWRRARQYLEASGAEANQLDGWLHLLEGA